MTRWDRGLIRKAKRLRSQGYTYSEIRQKIGKQIPKSTLSYWCHSVRLPGLYREKINRINKASLSRALKIAHIVNQTRRREYLDNLRSKNLNLLQKVDKDVLKLILAIFYLAEGAKYPSSRFLRFGSSDPETIKFFLRSFKIVFNTDPSKFRVDIFCRADQDIEKLQEYWIKITGIDRKFFYKPRVNKRTIGKKTRKRNYRGVCAINYFDTSLQLELQLLGEEIVKRV